MKRTGLIPILFCMMLLVQAVPPWEPGTVTGGTPDRDMLVRNGLLWMNVNGFSGSITTELMLADLSAPEGDDSVLFGTTSGIYILDLDTGEVLNRIPVAFPVTSVFVGDDRDGDRIRDVGYTCIDQVRPNVVYTSSMTGKKIWDFSPAEKVYTSNLGWHEEGTRSWDSIVLGESGGLRVFVTSWKSLYCLDAGTGEEIWKHTGSDDFWNVLPAGDLDGDSRVDLVVNTQGGALRAVSSADGKLIWNRVLEKSYDYKADLAFAKLKFSAPKSVWEPVLIGDVNGDGTAEIAVGSEMGNVFLVSGADGEKLWEKEVLALSSREKQERTSFFSDTFGNIIVRPFGDSDGDGLSDVCVLAVPESDDRSPKSASLWVLSSAPSTGKRVLSEKKSSPQFTFDGVTDFLVVPDTNGDGRDDLLFPSGSELKTADLEEGNFTGTAFVHSFFTANSDELRENVRMLPVKAGNHSRLLVTFGDNGVLLIDTDSDEIVWDFTGKDDVEVSTIGDIDGKGMEDVLVTTYVDYNGLSVRGIYTVSSETGKVLWEKKSSLESLAENSFHSLAVLGDADGDGINDLTGYLQENIGGSNDWDKYRGLSVHNISRSSRVFVISGIDGSYIWKRNLTAPFIDPSLTAAGGLYEDVNCVFRRIASADPVGDVTGDGIPDVLAMGESYPGERNIPPSLYMFSGADGSTVWIRGYSGSGDGGGDDLSWLKTFFRSDYRGNGTIRWTSSRDGVMGTGDSLGHLLSTGDHTITVSLREDGTIMDTHSIDLTVVPDGTEYADSKIETTEAIAGSPFHVSCWGPDEANYMWYSDLDGFLSDERETDLELSAGVHELTLIMENEGREYRDSWSINVRTAPPVLFDMSVELDGTYLDDPSNGNNPTDGSQLRFRVYERNSRDEPIEGYDISLYSNLDGLLGMGGDITTSLSAGNHSVHAEIRGNGTNDSVVPGKIYYNLTVWDASAPVADFNSGEQGRLNEYHYECHFPVSFDSSPSVAAAGDPQGHHLTGLEWYVDDVYAGNGSVLIHYFVKAGEHDVKLSVTNELGRSSVSTRTVIAFMDRQPEVGIAGPDRGTSYDTLLPVSLSAEARNVSFFGYRWESDLDGLLDCANSSISPYLSPGTHTITLTATACSGTEAHAAETVEVTAGPKLIASIEFVGKDHFEPDLREGVPFEVRSNVNLQGRNFPTDQLLYHWEADGNSVAWGSETNITLDRGTHSLFGIVEGAGQRAEAQRIVRVRSSEDPFAVITTPLNGTSTGKNVNFQYESKGGVDNVTWSLGDGNITYDAFPFHSYSVPGQYIVNLSARNDTYMTYDNRSIVIEVVPEGYPVPVHPLTSFSYSTTTSRMQFNGGGSYHSGMDTIDNYTWNMGEGTVLHGQSVHHAYDGPGTYDVELAVRDTGGNTSKLTRRLIVHNGGHPIITAMNVEGISYPDGDFTLSAVDTDLFNISAQVQYDMADPSLYETQYFSDIDGPLGTGKWAADSLGPGLHTVTASLVRHGESAASASRSIMVLDAREPVLILNAWDDTNNFHRNGLSFPAGHDIQLDVSSSSGAADLGLGAALVETSIEILSGGDTLDTLGGTQSSCSFDGPGIYHILVRAGNDLGVWAEKTYRFEIYERSVDVEITSPRRGVLRGREFEALELGVETNPGNRGFSSSGMLNVTWRSSKDGLLGTGDYMSAYLSRGEHEITVTVDNGRGLSANDSVCVRITEGAEPVAYIRDRHELTRRLYAFDEEVQLGAYSPRGSSFKCRWISDIDGVLGEGDWLGVRLSPGTHKITLECYTSPERIERDHAYVKVEGNSSLIVITEPLNGSITRGMSTGAPTSGDVGDVDFGTVEFLAREAARSFLFPLPNGSFHIVTASWDRLYCGLLAADGYAVKEPSWVFPNTYLDSLGNGSGGGENGGGQPRLSDHFSYIENFDANRISVMGDANDDGVDELALTYWGPGGNGIILLDVLTGMPLNLDPAADEKFNVLRDVERYNFASRATEDGEELFGDDYDGDGLSDLIAFDKWSEEWEKGPAVRAISSVDNSLIWEYQGMFGKVQDEFDRSSPVTFVEDMNGDGTDDVAVASTTDVLILDGKTGERLSRHQYQKSPVRLEWDENPPPVSYITEVGDFTGDGKRDLVLLYRVESEVKRITELVMIGTDGFTPYRTIPLPEANILSTKDVNGDGKADMMLSTSDLVFRLDSTFGLNILTPMKGETDGDKLRLSWDKSGVPCEVFVDRISWGYYDTGEAELTLTGGEHIIEVRLTDELGGTVTDTVVISVPESALPTAINYTIIGILFILFLLSFLLPLVNRARREKQMEKHKEALEVEEEGSEDEFITAARKNISRVWTREKSGINITEIFFEGENEKGSFIEYDDPGAPDAGGSGMESELDGRGRGRNAGRDRDRGTGPRGRLPKGPEQPRLPPPPDDMDHNEWDEDDSYGSRQWHDDDRYDEGGDWLD